MEVAESFKRFRLKFNLSKSDVARALNITPQAYEYESNKDKSPNLKTLLKLVDAYKVSLDYLAGLTDDSRPVNQILAESASKPNKSEMTQAELQAELNQIKARLDKLEKS